MQFLSFSDLFVPVCPTCRNRKHMLGIWYIYIQRRLLYYPVIDLGTN